jgi:hypothetical protein
MIVFGGSLIVFGWYLEKKLPFICLKESNSVAQLFIQNPKKKTKGLYSQLGGLFATHPPLKSGLRYWDSSKFLSYNKVKVRISV